MTRSREQSMERPKDGGDEPDRPDMERRLSAAEEYRPEQQGDQRPAPAEVRGFARSNLLGDAEVNGFLSREFPQDHVSTNTLTDIEYTDRYQPSGDNGYVAGMCEGPPQGPCHIEVNRQAESGSYNVEQIRETISHEVGHGVHRRLPSQAQTEWESLSARSGPGERVSEYANKNAREDFAESYRAYIHDPELLLDVNPAKYTFLRDRVFDGREYR